MDITAVALQGLQEAQARIDKAAANLSRLSIDASSGDSVDLSAEVIALLAAQGQVETSVAIAKGADQMQQKLLDVLA
ncbi:MAG: hypothetical protein ABI693_03775 [Bryobacteraceae bacterium]